MELLTGLGLAVPAGLNAYIPLLTVALAQQFGWIKLDEPYALLGEWWVIALIAVLLIVELAADKIPAIDSVNDGIQTVVRPAAGGILFAAAAAGNDFVHPVVYIVAGVLLAGGVHAAKSVARPAVNVSTGGTGGPVVSVVEDVTAFVMTVLAIVAPIIGAILAAVVIVMVIRWYRGRRRPPVEAAT